MQKAMQMKYKRKSKRNDKGEIQEGTAKGNAKALMGMQKQIQRFTFVLDPNSSSLA